MEKFIHYEYVETLKQCAAEIQKAYMSIAEATQDTNQICNSIPANLYTDSNVLDEMFAYAERTQKSATEAVEYLPAELNKMAMIIEKYIAGGFANPKLFNSNT